MIVNQEYLSVLKEAGLTDFDHVYQFVGGQTVKKIEARSICRFEISFGNETRTLFLKRHKAERPSLGEWIKRVILSQKVSSGTAEFYNICIFRKLGISTAAPVAAGERRVSPLCYESFLITESMAPFVSLETIIRLHPEQFEGLEGKEKKRSILKAVANLIKKMHDAGQNHLDFNSDHVMIGPGGKHGDLQLALLDFQRIDRRRWMRFRWSIKTMAEIFYSMPDPVFNNDDRLYIFEQYNNRPSKGLWDRFVLKWIIRKARRIGKHTGKIIARKQKCSLEKR